MHPDGRLNSNNIRRLSRASLRFSLLSVNQKMNFK